MTSKELQRLGRRDLLELLIQQEKQNEILSARNAELEERLMDRTIQIQKAGSMAEAALALNKVFEDVDKAAAQYLENIKLFSEQPQDLYDRIVSEAEQKAKVILDTAEKEKQKKIKDADQYWKELSTKLEAFYQEHIGLRELISEQTSKKTSESR